ncbi:MAG: NAD(P)H-hydrate dehydratase [Deltaproteobacteria bacterium]|nr:NAD(P)H-hydrate dehydratase [Deltaproteobacteria bacterium]
MLLVVGTVPDAAFPVVEGKAELAGGRLLVAGRDIPVNRGTAALLAAAAATLKYCRRPSPVACLAGDIGTGQGSRRLYEYLVNTLPDRKFGVICFHYLQPDVDWHNRVLFAVQEMQPRPLLIADAGFMYVAKMSGQAAEYDLFTPDAGELAFLADETAPHPFYTRGFILHDDNKVPDLIARTFEHHNASRYILAKGETDFLADSGGILATVAEPRIDALEAIGGTGDTLTGITAGLLAAGLDLKAAAVLAARANRLAGLLAHPTPATQVGEIIAHLPRALEELRISN